MKHIIGPFLIDDEEITKTVLRNENMGLWDIEKLEKERQTAVKKYQQARRKYDASKKKGLRTNGDRAKFRKAMLLLSATDQELDLLSIRMDRAIRMRIERDFSGKSGLVFFIVNGQEYIYLLEDDCLSRFSFPPHDAKIGIYEFDLSGIRGDQGKEILDASPEWILEHKELVKAFYSKTL